MTGVSQERKTDGERKKGSDYIKFRDEDPVDRAVLVGVHNVQTAVLKVERGLSGWQQEEARESSRRQPIPKGRKHWRTSHQKSSIPPSEDIRGHRSRGARK